MQELKKSYEHILMRLLRRMQQLNRFVSKDLDFPLTIIQSFIILEIAAGRTAPSALAEIFGVEQSTMSRNLSALEKAGYLMKTPLISDSRKIALRLTPKGNSFLVAYDQASNFQIKNYAGPLTSSESLEYFKLYKKFNDGLAAPQLKPHTGDTDLRRELRRVAFALKLFRSSFMQSAISVAEWQTLSELYYSERGMSQIEISRRVGIAQSSLPALIKRLEQSGYIKFKPNQNDKRSREILLQRPGKEIVEQINEKYAARAGEGLVNFSKVEKRRFIDLFEKFIGETWDGKALFAEGLYYDRAESPEQKSKLRVFLINAFKKKNALTMIPARLFDEDSEALGIYRGRNLAGCLEYRVLADGILVINLEVPAELLKKGKAKSCLLALKKAAGHPDKKINIENYEYLRAFTALC